MTSLKALSYETKRTELAQASDSRALTSPGGNAALGMPGALSPVLLQRQFCYAAFAEEGF